MIESLYILNPNGNLILEKPCRQTVHRSVVDFFSDQIRSKAELLPAIKISHYVLLHIQRQGIFFIAIVAEEVPPLAILEFLESIVKVCLDYFGDISETTLQDNIVFVYQLLEEMIDHGYPVRTEPSSLKELLPPPSLLSKVLTTVTGSLSNKQPPRNTSMIPWRRSDIRYNQNEIYFDVEEEIDAIIDRNGGIVSCDISGTIRCNCKLSGMPDISMNFVNANLIEDPTFHPCIRMKRFFSEKILSFVPPDGKFDLFSYRVSVPTQHYYLPLTIKPQIYVSKNGGRMDISLQSRIQNKSISNVLLQIFVPDTILTIQTTCNVGKATYFKQRNVVEWAIDSISREKLPLLSSTISMSGEEPKAEQAILVHFKVDNYCLSGVQVGNVNVLGERYNPFKGIKNTCKSGEIEIRT